MTVTRKTRLLPTGYCFCGCGGEAEIGRWFVRGHDITAAAALRAVQGGLTLQQRLVDAGFGPESSVVQEAVQQAGWVRCEDGCAYAGPPAGRAAHLRAGKCTAQAQTPAGPGEPAAQPETPEPTDLSRPGPVCETAGTAPPVLAEAGAAQGRLLPAPDDPWWSAVPLELRQQLRGPAHQLVTPVQGPLKKSENRRLLAAVRAAVRMRMTGAQWHLLLTARREALGSPRSGRAGALFQALQQVAERIVPAVQEAADEHEEAEQPAEGTAGG
ncbi:hypothetical protein [Streptomyces sp. NBC_01601]|uniref:hypothetical protein n=1 Tax=Streptomyces sp. NBC_01601 TaxID=2975892 RepID=UPI002E2D68F9|nr:hypothetical protein [Streptomyces sp. NBC_01601]